MQPAIEFPGIRSRWWTHLQKILVCGAIAVVCSHFIGIGAVSAHNSLASSEPTDGSVLDSPPTSWSLTFTGEVPLESASGEIVLADGSRAALPAPVHGASSSVIAFALPEGLQGEVTGRWRLVGTDGHVITGRVTFSIAPAPVESLAPMSSDPQQTTTGNVPGTTEPLAVQGVEDEPSSEPQSFGAFVDPIPESARWVFQLLSYLGLIIFGGLVVSELILARGIVRRPRATLALQCGALAMFVAPAAMTLIHLADVHAVSFKNSFRHIGSIFDTTAGSMLVVRTLIGFILLMVTLTLDSRPLDQRAVKGFAGLVLAHIVTMPFTGHSRSMRWPVLGVPAGIVHIAAITLWAGGLVAIVAFIMPSAQSSHAVTAYRRFSSMASRSVIAIVVTGMIQAIRLYESPSAVFSSTHGIYFGIKIALVATMLGIGWKSRQLLLVDERNGGADLRRRLIRVTQIEAAVGVLVIGVSAALVRAAFSS
jgi:copper transport protein